MQCFGERERERERELASIEPSTVYVCMCGVFGERVTEYEKGTVCETLVFVKAKKAVINTNDATLLNTAFQEIGIW